MNHIALGLIAVTLVYVVYKVQFEDDTGPPGQKGADGLRGIPGETGPTGKDGSIGAQGPAGQPGVEGRQGAQGATGPAGKDGSTGAQGPAGQPGVQGPVGPVGTIQDIGELRVGGLITKEGIVHTNVWDKWSVFRSGRTAAMCMDVSEAGNGKSVHMYSCHGALPFQATRWLGDPTGQARIQTGHRTCLDVPGGDARAGVALQTWECNMQPAQMFGIDNRSRIVHRPSGLCVDLPGGGNGGELVHGTKLQLSNCDDGDDQRWGFY